ncbi:DUF2161 family putative PD-(D/E)XK-type phosphodiesterase [Virgibacillus sp. C22-A2]|uniref:DUF2161 family putative PD-(D/E)XK-type phosphodiesterase n=1 Tax=Virgibacillus tibetensis TaxID=3042313 RepID=A0ABU6KKE3_9BACI|nr:DUF2161 family putative PD-(D/E)XK-type phosphodiesterase [Virgibacillus sp. C22-A2]
MKKTTKLKEADLYEPIQTHFIQEGYEVYGEVKDCDMAVVKGDELIIIELKRNLSVDLLIQATKRLQISELVYIAVPKKPMHKPRSKRWKDVCQLVKKLELGLILVSFTGNHKKSEIIFHPTPYNPRKNTRPNKRKRQGILNEVDGRSADFNIGGTNRTQIMTAYRENCIQIACYLEQGERSPKALLEMGTGKKTSSILTKNYYGWFDRVRRGVYVLSEKGKQEVSEYPDLLAYYREKL